MRAEPGAAEVVGESSAIFATGRPLVLVVITVPGFRTASTFLEESALELKFSTTASMIQSTSASFGRSSSKLPMVTRRAREGSMKAAGFDFLAASSPAAATLLREFAPASEGTMSSKRLGTPALAKWAAMRAPIVPAPRTATFWMVS